MSFIGELAAIGNMVLSGIATVIIKSQGEKLKPVTLNLIQTTIAGISFIIITAAMGDFYAMFSIAWQPLLLLLGAAVMGIVLGNQLYFTSLQLIGVSKAYPITMTYPLLTYILEVIIFPEVTFNFLKLIGIIIVVAGIILISFSKANSQIEIPTANTNKGEIIKEGSETEKEELIVKENNPREFKNDENRLKEEINEKKWFKNSLFIGIFLAILAAITWASGTTMIKIGLDMTSVDIIPINAARMFLLIPITTLLFFSFPKQRKESKFTWKGILFVSLAALISLVGANILYLTAVDMIGTSTPAAFAASGPLIATPLSMIFLKEKVDWKIILGTVFTIGGIILIIFLG